jgi:hypothetical protein
MDPAHSVTTSTASDGAHEEETDAIPSPEKAKRSFPCACRTCGQVKPKINFGRNQIVKQRNNPAGPQCKDCSKQAPEFKGILTSLSSLLSWGEVTV